MAIIFLSITTITYSQQSEFNTLLLNETHAIAKTEGRVWREGSKLIIRTLKNNVVFFDNLTESESAARYIYIKNYLKNIYHLIYASGWEGHCFQLVNTSTGKCTRLDGIPILSPDNKFFVATSKDLEAGYNSNSIEICELTPSGPATVFFHNYKEFCGPSNPKWLDNKTILFDIDIPIQKEPYLKTRRTIGKIQLRNKSWVII